MAIDFTALDYSNKQALLDALRPAYYALISGQAEAEIEGADRRRVKFQAADRLALKKTIDDLEAEIARANNGTRRRFALMGRMHGPGRSFY